MKLFTQEFFETRKVAAGSSKLANLEQLSKQDPKIAKQDIFLSHSLRDKALIPGVLAFFDSYGVKTYVDIFDSSFPVPPSPATAEQVKSRIKTCRRLVVLVSEANTATSKWIPWEMGIADSFRDYTHVALLPVGRSEYLTAWLTNQEYFFIYPQIVRSPIQESDFPTIERRVERRIGKQKSYQTFSSSSEWVLIDPGTKAVWSLTDWLTDPL